VPGKEFLNPRPHLQNARFIYEAAALVRENYTALNESQCSTPQFSIPAL